MEVLPGSMAERGSVGVVGFMGLRETLIVDIEDALSAVLGLGRWGWPCGRRGRMGCSAVLVVLETYSRRQTYNTSCWVGSRIRYVV